MLIHVALDAYAFVGTHMFATNPATQRMAERTGLDSLSDPVLILDAERRIVRANDRAEDLFLNALSTPLPVPLETALGVSLETLRETGEITIGGDGAGTFALSYTPLDRPSGEFVGCMIVLYDVTEERQHGQQIAVLNRVLRHNLRNETTVISGYAEMLRSDVEDPRRAERAATIAAASDRLESIAEKVRSFEDVQERVRQPEVLQTADVLTEIERGCSEMHDEATVEWTVTPSELHLRTDRVLLSMLLSNLVENAIVHFEPPDLTTRISVSKAPDASEDVRFEVRDGNDPIPEHEIETLRAGEETPLQHGQGIGLWVVYWCVRKLHGEIDFEYDDGNVITVTVPPLKT